MPEKVSWNGAKVFTAISSIDCIHPNEQSPFGWQGQFCPLQSPKAFRENAKDFTTHIQAITDGLSLSCG
jgi:hypothetical protein